MTENKKLDDGAKNGCFLPENGFHVFVPYNKEPEKVIVCDVCGHKNPDNTALCEMCSNYLLG